LSCESFQNEIMPYLIVYSLNCTKNRHRFNTDENTGTCPPHRVAAALLPTALADSNSDMISRFEINTTEVGLKWN